MIYRKINQFLELKIIIYCKKIKRSKDQEIKRSRNQEIKKSRNQEEQEDQEFHAQSTKTLSYSHHQGRFEDIHQQEYQIRISNTNTNTKYEYQNFQDSIDNNH
jgi:hypothetical protein